MSGKIKSGQGTMIGNAGEYYVVAELLKRGVVAALTPRDMRAFDVLAYHHGRTVRIRVKTKSEDFVNWQWMAHKSGKLFHEVSPTYDFTILVHLALDDRDLAFYIIPTHTLESWLQVDYDVWVSTPSKSGKPHNPDTRHRAFGGGPDDRDRLAPFLNNWDLLWHEGVRQPSE